MSCVQPNSSIPTCSYVDVFRFAWRHFQALKIEWENKVAKATKDQGGSKKVRQARLRAVEENLETDMCANMLATAMAAFAPNSEGLRDFEEYNTPQHVKHLICFVAFLGDSGLDDLEALRNCQWGGLAAISNHPDWALAFDTSASYKLAEDFTMTEPDHCFPTANRHIKTLLSKVYSLAQNVDPRQRHTSADKKAKVDKVRMHIVYYHMVFAAWTVFQQLETGKGTRASVPTATMCALFPASGGLTVSFSGYAPVEQLDEDITQLCTLYNDEYGEDDDAPAATLRALLGKPWYLYAVLLCSLELISTGDGSPWPKNAPRVACQKLIDQWHFAFPKKQSTKTELALRGCTAFATVMRRAREHEEKAKEEQEAEEVEAALASAEAQKSQKEKEVARLVQKHLAEQAIRKKLVVEFEKGAQQHKEGCDFLVEAYDNALSEDPSFEVFEAPVQDVLALPGNEQSTKKPPKLVWVGLYGLDFDMAPDWLKAVKAIWKHKQNAQIAVHLDQQNLAKFLVAFEKAKTGELQLSPGAVSELPYVFGAMTESLAGVSVGREDAAWSMHTKGGGSMVHSIVVVLHKSQKQMEAQLERRATAYRDKGVKYHHEISLS